MSDEDKKHSSRSSTPNSTSTYRYSHEPYETFQLKVSTLAHSLGDFDHVNVEHIRGGSYNRVVRARLTGNNGGQHLDGVFRIPRFSSACQERDHDNNSEDEGREIDTDIQDQAAALNLLALKHIPAPKLLAFDATAANAIGSPYVFQEYSDGSLLDLVYDHMSLSEKLTIADALVELLLSMEKIRFSDMGHVRAAEISGKACKESYLAESKCSNLEVVVRPFDTGPQSQPGEDASSSSLADMLSRQMYGWCQQELFDGENPVSAMWKRLCEIFEEMRALEFLSSANLPYTSTAQSVLYHWDLEPRNIIVKRVPSSSSDDDTVDGSELGWTIDTVIDWDRVLAVPPILTRKPPIWLWDFSDDIGHSSISSDYDGDVDLLPPARYDTGGGKLSAEGWQVREHFQDRFVLGLAEMYPGYSREAYLEETYGRGRWIRRFARYAIHGASDTQDLIRFEHLDKE